MEFALSNPNEERLAMSCEMEIDEQGKIVNHRIFQSVTKSHARMTIKQLIRFWSRMMLKR